MITLLIALLTILLTTLLAAVPADAQNRGSSNLTFVVDLDSKTVEVTEIMQPARGGTSVSVVLPSNATNVSFEGRISGRSSLEDGYDQLNLVAGAGDALTYTLPTTTGRAVEGTRVTSAMIGFHLLPSFEQASVTVTLPQGFVANMGPAFVPQLIGDETLQYVLAPTNAEALWGLWFVAVRESGLVRELVTLENVDIEVAAWADDPEWMAFAIDHVTEGVPLLEEQIGQPWPWGDMWLMESAAPDQVGYGGWFDRQQNRIEITDTLDSTLFFHELAHAWFNDLVFRERWIIEGFAEDYATSVGETYGAEVMVAKAPDEEPASLDGLNDWGNSFWHEDRWLVELYGYNTSYWVVDQLRAEIGDEGMTAVIDGMFERRHPYALEGEGRQVGSNDWRRLLDMLELRGGSTTAEELFRDYVVTEQQAPLLDSRRLAMDRYADFEAESALAVPESIRVAMSSWKFRDAVDGMEEAMVVLDSMAELETRAGRLGLTVPPYLTDFYLRSDLDFALVESAVAETDVVLADLELNPDKIDADVAEDFQLGRFDEMELSVSRLNDGRDSGVSYRPYLIALAVLAVLLMLATMLWLRAELKPRPEQDPSAPTGGPEGPASQPPPSEQRVEAVAAAPPPSGQPVTDLPAPPPSSEPAVHWAPAHSAPAQPQTQQHRQAPGMTPPPPPPPTGPPTSNAPPPPPRGTPSVG